MSQPRRLGGPVGGYAFYRLSKGLFSPIGDWGQGMLTNQAYDLFTLFYKESKTKKTLRQKLVPLV
jgi:hypothetical protein